MLNNLDTLYKKKEADRKRREEERLQRLEEEKRGFR